MKEHPYRQEPLIRTEYKTPPHMYALVMCFIVLCSLVPFMLLRTPQTACIQSPTGRYADWVVFSTRDADGKSELHFRGPNGNEIKMNDEVRAHVDPCSMNDGPNPCYHANRPIAEMNNGGDLGFFSYWESTSPHSIWLNGDTQTWSAVDLWQPRVDAGLCR